MDHLTQRELLAFVHGQLQREAVENVYGHTALCERCGRRLRALRRIISNPDRAWESLVLGLGHAATVQAPRAHAALRVLVDASVRIASIAGGLLREFSDPRVDLGAFRLEPLLELRGVGYPGDEDRIRDLIQEAGRLLLEGRVDPARDRLAAAGALAPASARSSTCRLIHNEQRVALVVADSARSSVSVMLYTDAPGNHEERFRALLLDRDGRVLQETPFRPIQGADYLLAEFESLPDGEWVVDFELPNSRTETE